MNNWTFIAGAVTAGVSGALASLVSHKLAIRKETKNKKYKLFYKIAGLIDNYVQIEIFRVQAYLFADYHNKIRTLPELDGRLHEEESNRNMEISRNLQNVSMSVKRELDEALAEISVLYHSKKVNDILIGLYKSEKIQSIKELPDGYTQAELLEWTKIYKRDIKKILNEQWKKPLKKLKIEMKTELDKENIPPSNKLLHRIKQHTG